jgi:hypothetical protein
MDSSQSSLESLRVPRLASLRSLEKDRFLERLEQGRAKHMAGLENMAREIMLKKPGSNWPIACIFNRGTERVSDSHRASLTANEYVKDIIVVQED